MAGRPCRRTPFSDGLTDAFVRRREVLAQWRAFTTRDRLSADIPDFGQCACADRGDSGQTFGDIVDTLKGVHP
jgi:hypothetical protein